MYLDLGLNQFAEHSVGNIVRKVLHHIREEYSTATQNSNLKTKSEHHVGFSISNFLLMGQPKKHITHSKSPVLAEGASAAQTSAGVEEYAESLKPLLMDAMQDIEDELKTVYDSLSKTAKDHIHSECVASLFRSGAQGHIAS